MVRVLPTVKFTMPLVLPPGLITRTGIVPAEASRLAGTVTLRAPELTRAAWRVDPPNWTWGRNGGTPTSGAPTRVAKFAPFRVKVTGSLPTGAEGGFRLEREGAWSVTGTAPYAHVVRLEDGDGGYPGRCHKRCRNDGLELVRTCKRGGEEGGAAVHRPLHQAAAGGVSGSTKLEPLTAMVIKPEPAGIWFGTTLESVAGEITCTVTVDDMLLPH